MLRIRQLGLVPYAEAFDLQHALAERAPDDYLLLLEHPHVYTMGVRTDPANLLVDPATVGALAVTTDRGGDITYHGPGQLVVYAVRTVEDDPAAGRSHVRQFEQIVIDSLTQLGAEGPGRLEGYPGVWLDAGGPRPAKVAAVGVRTLRTGEQGGSVRRRTLHGVAINICCDLSMFGHIVPCGIRNLPVTSLEAEGVSATVAELAEAVIEHAAAAWGTGAFERVAVTPSVSSARPTQHPPEEGIPVALGKRQPASHRRIRRAGVDLDRSVPLRSPKPEHLRIPVRMGADFHHLERRLHTSGLHTVCEEAGCPNIYECWADGTATFMINGNRCTRACGFCQVDTRHPLPLDADEPARVAQAVAEMGLGHAVVTCVARDDLEDGGAGAMAATVRAIRDRKPDSRVEVLISDCKGEQAALQTIFDAQPDVLNHNIETVARLQRAVRPSASYARSLSVLARAASAGLRTKSGLMVGLGEEPEEVLATLADLASVGVTIATIGHYLRPSAEHLPVARWWAPEEFEELRRRGLALGLSHVEASPLTRSSYHARSAAEAVGPLG